MRNFEAINTILDVVLTNDPMLGLSLLPLYPFLTFTTFTKFTFIVGARSNATGTSTFLDLVG